MKSRYIEQDMDPAEQHHPFVGGWVLHQLLGDSDTFPSQKGGTRLRCVLLAVQPGSRLWTRLLRPKPSQMWAVMEPAPISLVRSTKCLMYSHAWRGLGYLLVWFALT